MAVIDLIKRLPGVKQLLARIHLRARSQVEASIIKAAQSSTGGKDVLRAATYSAMGGAAAKIYTVIATEASRAQREGSAEVYKAANAGSWIWRAQADACEYCDGQDGLIFTWDEDMNDMTHPNCRCEMEPVLNEDES